MLDATRHLVCTPVRPTETVGFAPAWRTETVAALAHGIVVDAALDRLPVLADALEEAGCNDVLLLRHCRECGQHTTKCWALGAVLARPPAVEPERMPEWRVRREVERVTGRPVIDYRGGPEPGTYAWAWKLVPFLVLMAILWFLNRVPREPVPARSFTPAPPPTQAFPLGK